MRVAFLIGGLALAVIIVVAIQYGSGLIAEDVEPLPAVVAEPQAPPDAVPEPESLLPPPPEVRAPESHPEVELPPLGESDAFVVEHLAGFGWPDLWLDREELIRRLAIGDSAENNVVIYKIANIRSIAPERPNHPGGQRCANIDAEPCKSIQQGLTRLE